MEKAMTVEEKIRRAEEIYARRKMGNTSGIKTIAKEKNKEIKLLKKMFFQLIICIFLYMTIYLVQNRQYVFSKDFLNKVNEILSYDTNFFNIYDSLKNKINDYFISNDNTKIEKNEVKEKIENNNGKNINEEKTGNNQNETSKNEDKTEEISIGGAKVETNEKKELTQDEKDIENVKKQTTFIKPIEGTITSKYGFRETATGTVPKNHTGTDIGANLGTKIKSSTDGEVVIASSEGDYRKTFKNSNWKSKYYLCTLQ